MDVATAEKEWRGIARSYSSFMAALFLAGFATYNLSLGNTAVALLLYAGVPFLMLTFWASRRKPLPEWWAAYPALGYLLTMLTVLMFVWNHGDGVMLIWLMVVPVVAIFGLGVAHGLVMTLLFFALMVATLLFVDHALPDPFAIRLVGCFLFATAVMFAYERQREIHTRRLIAAEDRVRTLEGMLSICGWCHKWMRDEAGDWVSTEQFFEDRAPVQFTHGLCPTCASKIDTKDTGTG